jgi:hypothetical protein
LSRAADADDAGNCRTQRRFGQGIRTIVSEIEARSERWAAPGAGLILAAFTVYLGFNAGGFFPGAVAYATIGMAVLLILGIMLAHEPLTNSPPALLVTLGSLAAFAALTLVSGSWSNSWSRAIIEFDRVLLYVLVLAFFGLLRRRPGALEWGLRGFVLAAFIICTVALITRVAPDVWPISTDVQPQRLSFPLTYWNALGLLSALGSIGLVHLTSGDEGGRLTRIAGAALPLMMATLLLTFSRSSLALTVIGIVFYLLLVRPKRSLAAGLALIVPIAVALVAVLKANTVSSARYTTDAGVTQGHHLALIVVACVVVAALLRWAALRLDDRLDRWQPPRFAPVNVAAVAAGALVVLVLVGVAAGGPGWVKRHWDNFVQEDHVGHVENPSERLSAVGNNGRIPQWRVAVDAFDEKPLLGKGAGTYALQWDQHRPLLYTVVNAHSLYVEVMAELGIVGLLLLLGALLTILAGTVRRLRAGEGQSYGLFLVLAVIWMLHAGVDWDWQMPAVTLWLFALGGTALSRSLKRRRKRRRPPLRKFAVRAGGVLACLALAILPAKLAISQARLEDAIAALDRGDCAAARDHARSALDAVSQRPAPYAVVGYCDLEQGHYAAAAREMAAAQRRDPESSVANYDLAVARAAAGLDPVPAVRTALRQNPLEPRAGEALAALAGGDPAVWKREGRTAALVPPRSEWP